VKFFLDQDVPDEVAQLLRHLGHEATVLREALPIGSVDDAVFAHARAHGMIMITCNRDDYLALAAARPEHPGLVILVRRRTRQAECGKVLELLRRAGETGLRGNINFACGSAQQAQFSPWHFSLSQASLE
jgi:predicted nuclease of predicted toxin-antitoxin system